MTDRPVPDSGTTADDLRARLLACAQELRETRQIEPSARTALADLVEELVASLDPAAAGAHTDQLVESSTHLLEALHGKQDAGVLTAARGRLEDVAARAETSAPVATGIVRQLIDLLAGIGV